MKNIFLTLLIIMVLALGVGVYLMLKNDGASKNPPSVPTFPTSTPLSPSTPNPDATISIAGENGPVLVKNFLLDETTVTDKSNQGHYYIAGEFSPTSNNPEYSIVYKEKDQAFTIGLWREPLSQTRIHAEEEFLRVLGISKEVACRLRYVISAPYEISPFYSGKNLGFSFCPGAVEL